MSDYPEHEKLMKVSDASQAIGQFLDFGLPAQGDCLTFNWPKGTRWDCVWHDVWDNLCAGNLRKGSEADPFSYEEMHRKFGRRCNWQGSWGFDFLKARER
jgi:hypothetical protein